MEKIIIPGHFFDCRVYGERLYLWTTKGSILVVNYKQLLESFKKDKKEVKLSGSHLILFEVETPTGELPIDVEIFNNDLYVAVDSGLYRQPLAGFRNCQPKKLWDCRLSSLSGGKRKGIALSAGADGLFLFHTHDDALYEHEKKMEYRIGQISERLTSSASFCRGGIYGTSLYSPSYYLSLSPRFNIHDSPAFTDKEIFNNDYINTGLSWSRGDELFLVHGNTIILYTINTQGAKPTFKYERAIKFEPWKGELLSASSGRFGYVFELDHAVVVLDMRNRVTNIHGEAVCVKTYSRSRNYKDEVHIVMNDYLSILIFDEQDVVEPDERADFRKTSVQ